MKKILRFLALAMLIGMFANIDCKSKLSEYQNEHYQLIDEKIEIKALEEDQVVPVALQQGEPVVTTEDIKRDYFTSNAVITLVMQQMNDENNAVIETTRVFKTKNPTIFTWSNAALAAGALALIGTGAAYVNGITLEDVNNIPDYLRYGLTSANQRDLDIDKKIYEITMRKELTPEDERHFKEFTAYDNKLNKRMPKMKLPKTNHQDYTKSDKDFWNAIKESARKRNEWKLKELQKFIEKNPENTIAVYHYNLINKKLQ